MGFRQSAGGRARTATSLLTLRKGGISLTIAVISLIFQFRIRALTATLWCVLAGVLTYGLLAAIEFVVNFVREGSALYEEKQTEIQSVQQNADRQIAEIKSQLMDAERDRPRLVGEIPRVHVDGDHERPDWIKVFVFITIRNQGAPSVADRWKLEIVTPLQTRAFFTEAGLSPSQESGDKAGRNLLHNETVIPKGGRLSGWLLLHSQKPELGNLDTGKTPLVLVSFCDIHGNEYSAEYPLGFWS